ARVLQGEPGDSRKIAVAPRLDGHGPERFHAPPLRVLFIVDEEEALVPPDRAARRSAELIAIQTARLRQKCVAGVKHVVAPELEQRAMQAVGSGLGDQADL